MKAAWAVCVLKRRARATELFNLGANRRLPNVFTSRLFTINVSCERYRVNDNDASSDEFDLFLYTQIHDTLSNKCLFDCFRYNRVETFAHLFFECSSFTIQYVIISQDLLMVYL